MEVEWTVYDRLRRVVVYKTVTRGYSKMDLPNYEAIDMMIDDSFGVATNNLGADAKFHDLLVSGVKPPKAADKNALFGPVGKFGPDDAVAVKGEKLRDKMDLSDLDHIRRAAVLVSTGAGHAPAFSSAIRAHISYQQPMSSAMPIWCAW